MQRLMTPFVATVYPGGVLALELFILGVVLILASLALLAFWCVAAVVAKRKARRFYGILRLAFFMSCCAGFLMALSAVWILFSELQNGTDSKVAFQRAVSDWDYYIGIIAIVGVEFLLMNSKRVRVRTDAQPSVST